MRNRNNNVYIGNCKDCEYICLENNRQSFKKNHKGDHIMYSQGQIKNKIDEHLNQTTQKYYEKKVILIKQFFQQLRKKINIIEKRRLDQLSFLKLQSSFHLGDMPFNKAKALAQYCQKILNGQANKLNCKQAHFFITGLQKAHKMIINGENINNRLLNKWVKQSKNQAETVIMNLQKEYLTKLDGIDVQIQNKLKTMLQEQKKANEKKMSNTIKIQRDNKSKKIQENKQRETKQLKYINQPLKDYKKRVTLIKQAPQNYQFSVRIRIQKVSKIFQSRKGPRFSFLGSDKSGKSQFTCQKNEYIVEGNQIIIDRCKIQQYRNQKLIVAIYESDIILVNSTKINNTNSQNQARQFDNKKIQREYDARIQRNDKKVTKIRQQIQQQNYTKVKGIEPDSQNMTLCVKIIQIHSQISTGLICTIGDETGIVRAQLPASQNCIIDGGTIIITGAYSEVRDQHILIVLKDKNKSKVKKCLKSFPKIGRDNDISATPWVQES